MSAKDRILERLKNGEWLASFEFKIMGVSENSLCSRLPELALAGLVEGRVRKGKNFKEWHYNAQKTSGKADSSPDTLFTLQEL